MPRLAAAIALLALLAAPALARDPEWGGLGAVAASPDGKTVVCGGENRVLYVLDAATREVRQRIWVQARVGGMAFSKDGARFTFEDDEEVLHVFETSTWKEFTKLADVAECAWAPAADLVAGISYKGKGLVFVSLADGTEKGRVAVAGKIAAIGIDPAGGMVAVLMEASLDAAEKKVDAAAMPKDLKSAASKEWQQKNDGLTAVVKWFEVPSGKPTGETKTFYSARPRPFLCVSGDTATVITYDDSCAKITPRGDITLFEVTGRYNYARGASADNTFVIGGGLRSGAIVTLDGGTGVKFEIDRLPGLPEYFGGFAPAADGGFWAVTSASRIVKISKDGKIEGASPVF